MVGLVINGLVDHGVYADLSFSYWLDEWDGTLAGSRVCLSILFLFPFLLVILTRRIRWSFEHCTHLCAHAFWTRCPLRHTSSSEVAPV